MGFCKYELLKGALEEYYSSDQDDAEEMIANLEDLKEEIDILIDAIKSDMVND